MKIITWNINSIRMRMDLLIKMINQQQPDVICLQETKVTNDAFPLKPLIDCGYGHIHIAGMKSYNGVAIISRLPLAQVGVKDWCGRQDCRHIFAALPDGIELHNVYIPSGGDIPDPSLNEKFNHKLRFLDEMIDWWPQHRSGERAMIMVGDFNIAPMEHDVWSHAQMQDVISHTPIEVEKLNSLQASIGWVDSMRTFVPPDRKLYSWWSYRAHDWERSDRGRRLDHIWVTPALSGSLKQGVHLREARGWLPKPSDHVPVSVELAV